MPAEAEVVHEPAPTVVLCCAAITGVTPLHLGDNNPMKATGLGRAPGKLPAGKGPEGVDQQ